MAERAFVLMPLNELVPDLVPPGERQLSIHELLDLVDVTGINVYKERHG
jgi:7,8-dihydro-6-hydroxymethylpterin-pyrophosphokinase